MTPYLRPSLQAAFQAASYLHLVGWETIGDLASYLIDEGWDREIALDAIGHLRSFGFVRWEGGTGRLYHSSSEALISPALAS